MNVFQKEIRFESKYTMAPLVFVDFEKAFDSVDREGLWMALRRRDIPYKLVSVIKSTYNGAKCRVLHNDTLSAPFVVGS